VDAITNLALLARDDNSVLSNAVFEVKRRHVIALDRGGAYIPVCTRNVFLKYYTDAGVQQLHFWAPSDRQGYLNAMLDALGPYLQEDVPRTTRPRIPMTLRSRRREGLPDVVRRDVPAAS